MNFTEAINFFNNTLIKILEFIPKIFIFILSVPLLLLKYYFIGIPLIFYLSLEIILVKKGQQTIIKRLFDKLTKDEDEEDEE